MHAVRQINPYSCVLACIESYLLDHGESVSQEEMMQRYPVECQSQTPIRGSVRLENLPSLLSGVGLRASQVLETVPDQEFFLLTTTPSYHCIRHRGENVNGELVIMDPVVVSGEATLNCGCVQRTRDVVQATTPIIYRIERI